MPQFREAVIKLAREVPELRKHLVPLLRAAGKLPPPSRKPQHIFIVVSAWNESVKALQWAKNYAEATKAYKDQIGNAHTLNVSNVYLLGMKSSTRWEIERVWDADQGEIKPHETPYGPNHLKMAHGPLRAAADWQSEFPSHAVSMALDKIYDGMRSRSSGRTPKKIKSDAIPKLQAVAKKLKGYVKKVQKASDAPKGHVGKAEKALSTLEGAIRSKNTGELVSAMAQVNAAERSLY